MTESITDEKVRSINMGRIMGRLEEVSFLLTDRLLEIGWYGPDLSRVIFDVQHPLVSLPEVSGVRKVYIEREELIGNMLHADRIRAVDIVAQVKSRYS